MKQPSRNINKEKNVKKSKNRSIKDKRLPPKQKVLKKRTHPDFGTSKAEQSFAVNFLDKLGVRYIWQFKAEEIGRFYDFYLPDYNVIIEWNGSYWHADPRLYEEKDLNPTQKRSRRIDEEKKSWAIMNKIPIYYVWEKDVNEHPDKVMEFLMENLKIQQEVLEKKKNMAKRHVNGLNNLKKT